MFNSYYASIRFPKGRYPNHVWNKVKTLGHGEFDEHGVYSFSSVCRSGEFEELETLFIEQKVPFDRQSENSGYGENSPEIRYFRPDLDMDKVVYLNQDGEPYITIRELEKIMSEENHVENIKKVINDSGPETEIEEYSIFWAIEGSPRYQPENSDDGDENTRVIAIRSNN